MSNSNNLKTVKIAVTGAAGQIGYALLYRIASGQMFGPHTEVELQLLELESALGALRGVSMELEDCAFPLLRNITCTAIPAIAFKDANWCLLIGSVPRKQGMERSDLLKINGSLFSEQGKAINDYASDNVRVFVVGNPCNTNCLIASQNAPRIPKERFFAMTILDENRARMQLALKATVSVSDVSRMIIWGNHSSKQFPDFYNARIKGLPVIEVIRDENWLKNEFVPTVQQRGTAIIKARGLSSAASAANAIVDSVVRLLGNHPDSKFFSVSLISQGEYGVDPGLVFSFPVQVLNGAVKIHNDIEINDYSKSKIAIVLDELRQEREVYRSL